MPIAVLGMGKTGQAIARHFANQGKEVWGIEDRLELHADQVGVTRLFSAKEPPPWKQVERFFISPGVDPKHPAAQAALKKGLSLEGELDLAFSQCQGDVVAITGTNGKSTTTALLGAMFEAAQLPTGVGGNLGTPFLDLVNDENTYSTYVVEVSSFQLETTQTFRPKVAALLNLSEDHLDRHPSLENYLQAKRKIFAFQTPQDFAVYNDDDLRVLETVEGISAQKIPFSNAKKVAGVYGNEQELYWAPQGEIKSRFSMEHCSLKGLHNLENISAAIACAKLMELPDESIQQALHTFSGLPHRIELVAQAHGVDYFDDSKATNVGAVVMSLASFDQDVILIMGGVDKGGDYHVLKALLKSKAKAVIVFGEAKAKILAALKGSVELIAVPDMKAAVEQAQKLATPGTTVLLAPACASFDQYANYKERGEDFKHWVKEALRHGTKTH